MLKAHYQHLNSEYLSISDFKAATTYYLKPGERVVVNYHASRITPFAQQQGELLIGENNLYFIDERIKQGGLAAASRSGRQKSSIMGNKQPKQVMFPYEEIREIHKRRHLLKSNALEIFLVNGKTYLLAFEKSSDRDAVYKMVLKL